MPRCNLTALLALASLAMHATTSAAAVAETDGGGLLQQGKACFAGWDATCQDNPLFTSRLGLGCAMHVVVDCDLMVEIGFTAAEQDELILNCPCSCQIEW
jgi:hypothetical protein